MNTLTPTLGRQSLTLLAGGLTAGLLAATLLGPAVAPARAQTRLGHPRPARGRRHDQRERRRAGEDHA